MKRYITKKFGFSKIFKKIKEIRDFYKFKKLYSNCPNSTKRDLLQLISLQKVFNLSSKISDICFELMYINTLSEDSPIKEILLKEIDHLYENIFILQELINDTQNSVDIFLESKGISNPFKNEKNNEYLYFLNIEKLIDTEYYLNEIEKREFNIEKHNLDLQKSK